MAKTAAVLLMFMMAAGCSTTAEVKNELPKFFPEEDLKVTYTDITCYVEGAVSGAKRPCDDPSLGTLFGAIGKSSAHYENYSRTKSLSTAVLITNVVLMGGIVFYSGGVNCNVIGNLLAGGYILPNCGPALLAGLPGTILAVYLSYDAEKYLKDAAEAYKTTLKKR